MILLLNYEALCYTFQLYILPQRIRFSHILLWFWENSVTEWHLSRFPHNCKECLYKYWNMLEVAYLSPSTCSTKGFRWHIISGFYAPYKLPLMVFPLTLTDNYTEILLFKSLSVAAVAKRDGCHLALFLVNSSYNPRIHFLHTTITILSLTLYYLCFFYKNILRLLFLPLVSDTRTVTDSLVK
jgi:hypothetical protein